MDYLASLPLWARLAMLLALTGVGYIVAAAIHAGDAHVWPGVAQIFIAFIAWGFGHRQRSTAPGTR